MTIRRLIIIGFDGAFMRVFLQWLNRLLKILFSAYARIHHRRHHQHHNALGQKYR